MRQSLPLGPLLLTVFTSILEVFLLCLAGYILASRGILDKRTQKQLNRLNVSLFTPALLFSKVAFFLSPEKLRELWIIPILFVVVTAVSMIVSFLLGSAFKLKKSQRAFAMAASMFMNSNSLPIALMQSLVITMGHSLRWTDDDNKNTMLGRALTYLVLYSTLGMILRWSYGVRLLSQADEGAIRLPDEEPHEDLAASSPEHESEEVFHSYANESGSDSAPSPIVKYNIPAIAVEGVPQPPRPQRKQSKFYNSFPNSPNQSRVALPEIETAANSRLNSDDETTEDEDDVANRAGTLPIYQRYSHQNTSSTRRFRRYTVRHLHRLWVAFSEFMTAPLWAALLSIVVALIQPLQHALDAHMQPVKGALTSAGNCSIPVTLIVLGAYFYPASKEDETTTTPTPASGMTAESSSSTLVHRTREALHSHKSSSHSSGGPGETKTVITAVLSRMIITPLLLLPLIAWFARIDVQEVFEDPVFVISNVLLVASPPALTLAQITQAASGDAFERLISRTIFWSYCILTPLTTILFVVVGLLLSRL